MVRSDADTVNVDEPVLWGCRFTVDGARDVDGFEGERPAVRLAGVTWAEMFTAPENPLMLASPKSLSISIGASRTSTLTLASINRFSRAVNISAQVTPAQITAGPSPPQPSH